MGWRILKASAVITFAHILAKLLGLVQSRIIGDVYGMGIESDAFIIAFDGVIMTLFFIVEESFGPAFLPVFMESKEKENEARAWRFTSTLLNIQLGLLLAAVAVLYFFPAQTVNLLTRDDNANPDRTRLAIHFLGAMAPSLVGLSISSLTYMILNGYKEFFWPAFADAALKAALVGGVIVGHKIGLNADALIVGALGAGATKLAVHLFAIGGRARLYRPVIDLKDPYVQKFFLLVAPLLMGIVFAKVRDYFNNIYVLSSLEPGMLSINSNGRKIFNTIGAVIPYPLSIAMFPFFCELVARNDRKALGDFLTQSSRILILFFLPVSIVIFMLSDPFGRLVFETGQVGADTAAQIGHINSFYCMALPFQALEYMFMQAYFSSQRFLSVSVVGILFSALTMVVSYVGVVHYGLRGLDALVLVALSFSIFRALKVITLIALLKFRGLPVLPFTPTLVFALRVLVLGLACGGASYATLRGVDKFMPAVKAETAVPVAATEAKAAPETAESNESKDADAAKGATPPKAEKKKKGVSGWRAALRAAPRLAIPGLAAAVVFLLGCKILRLTELDTMIHFAKEKLNRRKKKSPVPPTPPAPAA